METGAPRKGHTMAYKAIFFDRDGTLTYANPAKLQWRDQTLAAWSGHAFSLPYDKMMRLFGLAAGGRQPWYRNLDDERAFMQRYYRHLLAGEGIARDLDARAGTLFAELWCNNDRLLYPDVVAVLDFFKRSGYRMGVISDTSPSLELTLRQLGIAGYFTSFTASSLVGAGKPSPIIFSAALVSLGVSAAESLYVDDYDPEADGARQQGFTAFNLDRGGAKRGPWVIHSLTELIDFAERNR